MSFLNCKTRTVSRKNWFTLFNLILGMVQHSGTTAVHLLPCGWEIIQNHMVSQRRTKRRQGWECDTVTLKCHGTTPLSASSLPSWAPAPASSMASTGLTPVHPGLSCTGESQTGPNVHMSPHQCQTEGSITSSPGWLCSHGHRPGPSWLFLQGTVMSPVWLVHHNPQILFCKAAFLAVSPSLPSCIGLLHLRHRTLHCWT